MIRRIYTERREAFRHKARALCEELATLHGISGLRELRTLIRYDVDGLTEDSFSACVDRVFADPRTDLYYYDLPQGADFVFAVEYLPGQYDSLADAAMQCARLVSRQDGVAVRCAAVYLLYGELTEEELARVKSGLINPVDSQEAELTPAKSLDLELEEPQNPRQIHGFSLFSDEGLSSLIRELGLAMDIADARCIREYFREQGRDPSLTELKVIDSYWSDHCRHTTFNTEIDEVRIEDEDVKAAYERYLELRRDLQISKPPCLMDIATIGAKQLKRLGRLTRLDESEEINACTVRVEAEREGGSEPWLLLFKNETHNHPTEIEPFGGAATCIGGAIRDPLSGRGYVYQGMRISGAADPRQAIGETMKGKLPARRLAQASLHGFSSYGNQIGLATGLVDELYHPGYAAKRLELGAVIAAAPAANVRRERPAAGDTVILIGGRTGRDGCGGATGSSKAHSTGSIERCGAEVQKGNAPEERKLQRLFRNGEAARLIKRCNDFGAGGVCVAIGELADGLEIELDSIPLKYAGLDATELAISESQERMAVVTASMDAQTFLDLANAEGLEATIVARVTAEPRLVMNYRGKRVLELSREFINSNGSRKHTTVAVEKPKAAKKHEERRGLEACLSQAVTGLNSCTKRGLVSCFDSTVGAGSVLMPLGGRLQLTPTQVMAAKLPTPDYGSQSCSVMSYDFDPFRSEASPYRGAYASLVNSVAKLVAAGADTDECWLSLQEYFGKPQNDPVRWGKPFAALLGALDAQLDLGYAAIGGKDSMSGSFESLDVPPTLVSFAVGMGKAQHIISPEFKAANREVVLLSPHRRENGLPCPDSLKSLFAFMRESIANRSIASAWVAGENGLAEGLFKQCIGNDTGLALSLDLSDAQLCAPRCGEFIAELACPMSIAPTDFKLVRIGQTLDNPEICRGEERVSLHRLLELSDSVLEGVYPTRCKEQKAELAEVFTSARRPTLHCGHKAAPRALVPVFAGTNCEYETIAALRRAGIEAESLVIRSLDEARLKSSIDDFTRSLDRSNILFIPGGFSNADEPDGSGKFIACFLQTPACAEAIEKLLSRDGLIGGVCNGFQALLRTGLLPYGRFTKPCAGQPALCENLIAHHRSAIVRLRVASAYGPWLSACRAGELYKVPISHGEGRFTAEPKLIRELAEGGRIITQYADEAGRPTMDIRHNPNGSVCAIEGICSPDGRILGKMGHFERIGKALYKNVAGDYDMKLFESAAEYFK